MDIAKMETAISEHAVTLGILVKSVNSIEGFMKESVESQKKQEVLMEKLASFEADVKGGFDRAHQRMDRIEADIQIRAKEVTDRIVKVEPLATKGASVHGGMVWTAKALGYMVLAMFFGMAIWVIKVSDYTPQ